jgi:hypothetical protein
VDKWVLTKEGSDIAKNGSHEARVFHSIPEQGIAIPDMTVPSILFNPMDSIYTNKLETGWGICKVWTGCCIQEQVDCKECRWTIDSIGIHYDL